MPRIRNARHDLNRMEWQDATVTDLTKLTLAEARDG